MTCIQYLSNRDVNLCVLLITCIVLGLDVIRWNFASNATRENHDALSMKLLQWLKN